MNCLCSREREIEKFRVAVSVPSGARMFFSLSYEELLPRRLGRYELSLGLRPGQPVQNLTLDVSITERTGISFIKVLPLKTSRLLSNTAQGKKGSRYSGDLCHDEYISKNQIILDHHYLLNHSKKANKHVKLFL